MWYVETREPWETFGYEIISSHTKTQERICCLYTAKKAFTNKRKSRNCIFITERSGVAVCGMIFGHQDKLVL
jgi:hypothetical protein